MQTILLAKTLQDGRKLEITLDPVTNAFFVASIDGAKVGTGKIDRRSTVYGAARMANLPATVAALVAGKIALTATELASLDSAHDAHPAILAQKAHAAKMIASAKVEAAIESDLAAHRKMIQGGMHSAQDDASNN